MSQPFLGQLGLFSFGFPPKGWALADGQTMQIAQNQALFALLGTTYGGDGVRTFQLPNLQGRVPMHTGNGFIMGQFSGEQSHTLTLNEMPGHTHPVQGTTAAGTVLSPSANTLATTAGDPYVTNPGNGTFVQLNAGTIPNAGGGQPHENRQPYLVISVCIALSGIFPTRN